MSFPIDFFGTFPLVSYHPGIFYVITAKNRKKKSGVEGKNLNKTLVAIFVVIFRRLLISSKLLHFNQIFHSCKVNYILYFVIIYVSDESLRTPKLCKEVVKFQVLRQFTELIMVIIMFLTA